MTTATKQLKTERENHTNGVLNGTIDQYFNRTKEQLIQEIVNLKDKINYYEDLFKKRDKRNSECIMELNQILNNK